MNKSVPYSKPKGAEPFGSHELASGDTMLVRPTLGDKARDTRQGDAPALTTVIVNEEHSSGESQKGNQMATSVNVFTDKASLNFGGEHQYVYGIDDGAKKEVKRNA